MNLDAYRLARQNDITAVDYYDLMMDNIDEASDKRLQVLKEIEKDKLRVAIAYNKKVKLKSFQVGDLVWKTILPLGMKSNKFGKWSPNWEGPYKIIKVVSGNSYMMEAVQGEHCNEHGTIYAISSDFGDRMTTQSMGLMLLLSEHF